MNIVECIQSGLDFVLGWPLIIWILGVAVACTILTGFVQIRKFISAWIFTFKPQEKAAEEKSVDMTPLQAFINTLSANLGNASLAGMGTAICAGGPGAAFWVIIAGLLLMAVRFAEVYLSLEASARPGADHHKGLGGPMLYLRQVPFGKALAYLYGVLCVCYGFIVGNMVQTNSIADSVKAAWGVHPYISAALLFLLVLYTALGGSSRIAALSEKIVPIKVVVFFAASISLLCFHWKAIIPSIALIVKSAFTPVALAGGVLGFGIQVAMRYGISRVIMSTEAGLGTAAVMFGATGSKEPVRDAIMAMLSTFISTVVCFIVALCIIASGVWQSGANSAALTIASFQTLFGSVAGWIVSFLAITFGVGVLVAFVYVAQEAWLFVTGGRWRTGFIALFCTMSAIGAIAQVEQVWLAGEVANAGMLFINLFGIVWLLPVVYRGIRSFMKRK